MNDFCTEAAIVAYKSMQALQLASMDRATVPFVPLYL